MTTPNRARDPGETLEVTAGELKTTERVESHALVGWQATKQVNLILICMALVTMIVAIDATILVPALPTIARALDGTASETFWTGSSYLLTSATFQPLLGALSDILGRREVTTVAIVLFTAGTLVCCLAQNFTTLLVGRTIQGIGGGGILSLNLIIISDIVPLRYRPKYNGYTQAAFAFGTVAGPLIGGAIAQGSTWRLLFYMNFPFCALGLLTIPWVVRLEKKAKLTLQNALETIDWVGSGLFMGGATSFLLGITWANHDHPWNSHQTIVPIVLGLVGIALAGVWELWFAASPFIRRTMLRNRDLMTAYASAILHGLLLYADLYYISFYLLSVKGRSPLLSGVALLPITLGLMPSSALTGIAISRIGSWKWSLYFGWGLTTLASGLLILLDAETPTAGWVFIFLVTGLAQGALVTAHALSVQVIADGLDVAYAAALFSFMRSLGMCLGVAIGGTVFQNRLQTALGDVGLPIEIAEDAEAFGFQLLDIPWDADFRIKAIIAFEEGFRFLFEILTGISGAGFLLSFAISGKHSLDKALQSDHVLRASRGTEIEESPDTSPQRDAEAAVQR